MNELNSNFKRKYPFKLVKPTVACISCYRELPHHSNICKWSNVWIHGFKQVSIYLFNFDLNRNFTCCIYSFLTHQRFINVVTANATLSLTRSTTLTLTFSPMFPPTCSPPFSPNLSLKFSPTLSSTCSPTFHQHLDEPFSPMLPPTNVFTNVFLNVLTNVVKTFSPTFSPSCQQRFLQLNVIANFSCSPKNFTLVGPLPETFH